MRTKQATHTNHQPSRVEKKKLEIVLFFFLSICCMKTAKHIEQRISNFHIIIIMKKGLDRLIKIKWILLIVSSHHWLCQFDVVLNKGFALDPFSTFLDRKDWKYFFLFYFASSGVKELKWLNFQLAMKESSWTRFLLK